MAKHLELSNHKVVLWGDDIVEIYEDGPGTGWVSLGLQDMKDIHEWLFPSRTPPKADVEKKALSRKIALEYD